MIGQSLEEALHFVGERSRKKPKQLRGWRDGVKKKEKKIKRPLFPYLATSKCKKVFVGVLFSCRSFAHLRSGQDKGLWGFSAAREHLRALSSCSSFSSSQWSQSQTSCRSQLRTHCWSGHAWDRKEIERQVSELSVVQYSASTLRTVKDKIRKEAI